MDIKRLVKLMQKKPYLLKMGKGLLARRYKTKRGIGEGEKKYLRKKKREK